MRLRTRKVLAVWTLAAVTALITPAMASDHECPKEKKDDGFNNPAGPQDPNPKDHCGKDA